MPGMSSNMSVSERENMPADAPMRDERGRLLKGVSGNPGGRPKGLQDVQALAREHTKLAIETLVKWAKSDNPQAAVAATNSLLDRGYGKATQPTELSGPRGGPIEIADVTDDPRPP